MSAYAKIITLDVFIFLENVSDLQLYSVKLKYIVQHLLHTSTFLSSLTVPKVFFTFYPFYPWGAVANARVLYGQT